MHLFLRLISYVRPYWHRVAIGIACTLLIIGLDHLFGTPPPPLAWLDNIMLVVWVFVVGATATTHFSGHETLQSQLVASLIFWLAALGFPTAMAIVHIAAYMK